MLLGVDKSIEKIRLDETNEVVERLKACSNSNTLTPPHETYTHTLRLRQN